MTEGEPNPGHPMYNGQLDDERLAFMAHGFADQISVRMLESLGVASNDTVLDLGAGSATRLGDHIKSTGARYIALDSNPSSVSKHHIAGHETVLSAATELPFEDGIISVLNARFSMSWLGVSGRSKSLQEVLRVGSPTMRGVVTEYDWSVARGHEPFQTLIASMRQALGEMGFEPDFGRDMSAELRHNLTERLGENGFQLREVREVIPAQSLPDKKSIIQLNAESVIHALHASNQEAAARALGMQLANILESNDPDILLPEVVSAVFVLGDGYSERQMPVQRVHADLSIGGGPPEMVTTDNAPYVSAVERLDPSAEHVYAREKARVFWAKVYRNAGFIVPDDLTSEELREATDPQELLQRSVIFSASNESGSVRRTARLAYPNQAGIESLPTVAKLVQHYGSSWLPEGLTASNTGEIISFASTSRSIVETIEIVASVMAAAADSEIEYVLFGAVAGGPSEHFKQLFGPAVHAINVDGQVAVIEVRGVGYREEGIPLEAAYLRTQDFFSDVIRHYESSNTMDSTQIINICRSMQTNQGVLR